jgi:shikimate kinase
MKRPLLQVADPLGRLRELHDIRDPLYRQTAHLIVETGRPSVAMLVSDLMTQLERAGILRGASSTEVASDSSDPAGQRSH